MMGKRLDTVESLLKSMNQLNEIELINDIREYLKNHANGFREVMKRVDEGKIQTTDEAHKAFKPYKGDGQSMESALRSMTTSSIMGLQKARESTTAVTKRARIVIVGSQGFLFFWVLS